MVRCPFYYFFLNLFVQREMGRMARMTPSAFVQLHYIRVLNVIKVIHFSVRNAFQLEVYRPRISHYVFWFWGGGLYSEICHACEQTDTCESNSGGG